MDLEKYEQWQVTKSTINSKMDRLMIFGWVGIYFISIYGPKGNYQFWLNILDIWIYWYIYIWIHGYIGYILYWARHLMEWFRQTYLKCIFILFSGCNLVPTRLDCVSVFCDFIFLVLEYQWGEGGEVLLVIHYLLTDSHSIHTDRYTLHLFFRKTSCYLGVHYHCLTHTKQIVEPI